MPTVRLVPNTYAVSSSWYVEVANAANMYTNTDSTTYGTVTSTVDNTTVWSVYLRGFNFSDIPNGAEVTAFQVKLKVRADGSSYAGTSVRPRLVNGTTVLVTENYYFPKDNTAHTRTFTTSSLSWSDIVGYGSNFGVEVRFRRSSRNTQSYVYVYGAEIAVTYTLPTPPVITVGTPSRTIISDEDGYDQCVCTFRSDLDLQAWEARATKAGTTPARGVGLLVESGTTLAANTDATVIVDDEELTNGDGEYTITVYGQSTGGVWSG